MTSGESCDERTPAFSDLIEKLRAGKPAVWINPRRQGGNRFDADTAAEQIRGAEDLWQRFAPAIACLFDMPGGSGRIHSPLLECPITLVHGSPVYVKADHALPVTACVKARGGIYALLRVLEDIAGRSGLLEGIESYETLAREPARKVFAEHTVVIASTGNLGFSVGVVATAFGLRAEVHMSDCAKAWKKNRLRTLGATVVEHASDYTATVGAARASAASRRNTHFIDDENSWDLFLGYAGAGCELAAQLESAGVEVSIERPLVAYLPCGVGGAPGGITYGLKTVFGDAAICVFAEPTDAACMLLALAAGEGSAPSVYDAGLGNRTAADGLAVSRASLLVLDKIRNEIDAAVAVPDGDMLAWVHRAWREMSVKLELSAAAGFAAVEPFLEFLSGLPDGHRSDTQFANVASAVHIVWTTGGNLMPDQVFERQLRATSAADLR